MSDLVMDHQNEVEPKTFQVETSLRELADLVLSDKRVKQGFIVLITDDDDYTEFKGHFYDNAVVMSEILREYKSKIYSEVFADRD